jgi:hypothetical protein
VQYRRVRDRGVIGALDLAGPQVELDAAEQRRARVGVEVGIDQIPLTVRPARWGPADRLDPLLRDPEWAKLQGYQIRVILWAASKESIMTISFDIPQEIEQQIRTDGVDLDRDAKEVYLMEQYRLARITHRQLEEALGLSFHEAEELLKRRDMGQDLDIEEFEAGRELLRKARPR